jgi:hypothetical protein
VPRVAGGAAGDGTGGEGPPLRGGEILYPSSEGDGALYVLLEGVVRLFGYYVGHAGVREATLRMLGPWESFGHPAFMKRVAGSEAERRRHLLRIQGATYV